MITGGATPELEHILAEGVGMRGGYSTPETLASRNRCRVDQLGVYEPPLNQCGVSNRTSLSTGIKREPSSLFQRLSVCIQRFNLVAFQGTFLTTEDEA